MKFILLFLLSLSAYDANSQISIRANPTPAAMVICRTSPERVDTFNTSLKYLLLNASRIEEMNVLKGSYAMEKFGMEVKNGLVIIKSKPYTSLLRINGILDKFKISDDDRTLRVCINQVLVFSPQLILADETEIETVEITTERAWTNSKDANSGEKFINIKTYKPAPPAL